MNDMSMGFPFRLNNRGSLATVDIGTIDHIEENITQILTTRRGERAMLPRYGCNVDYSLFENIEKPLYNILIKEIVDSIITWETHILLSENDLVVEAKNNTVTISLTYTLKVDGTFHSYKLQL